MNEGVFSTGSGPNDWTDSDRPPWLVAERVQPAELPLDFQLFALAHLDPWRQYAQINLASRQRAERVCHEVMLYIARWWHEFEHEPDIESAAWEVLRAGVTYEKGRTAASPSFFWKMTFGHAMVAARVDLADEEGPVLQAVAKLPPRQFDVIVLSHFMKRTREEIAWLLGLTPSTVDYHHRRARATLKQLLTTGRKGETA